MTPPTPETSDASPHHVVTSLAFDGAAFFGSSRFPFADGLNCLIGTHGTGKTTVIQSLRHVVGAPPIDPRADMNHAQALATLGHGELTLHVTTRLGQRFVCRRRGSEPPRVTTESGEHAAVSLDGDLFKIEVYAQNEIATMAESKRAQLALIDKFAAPEIGALNDAIARLDRQLVAKAAELKQLEGEIEDTAHRARDWPSVAAALEAVSQASGPDAAEAQRAHEGHVLRGREQAMLKVLRDEQRTVLAAADAFETEVVRRLDAAVADEIARSANFALLAQAHAASRKVASVVREAVGQVRRAIASADWAVAAAGDALGAAHASQSASYDAIVRRHDVDRGRSAERERLQRRLIDLELVKKQHDERRREHEARGTERQALIDARAKAIAERYALRARLVADITARLEGEVVLEIVAGGDCDEYHALLLDLCKGSNVRNPELFKAIATHVHPTDLAALVRANDPSAIVALDESRTSRSERAQRIVDFLRGTGRLGELDTVPLGDAPAIKLRVDGQLVLSSVLSIGQRCTAILPILFVQSASVLVIDQPEDQIDNGYIYDVLVKTLRKVKASRQVIFATHNPNFVVLGEADRVFSLQATNQTGRIQEQGTLDETRDAIERRVEGGREAFLLRSKRYGH